MDIQDLGALGELIGGVAVIASVIYLAVQIRHGITGYQSTTILETTNHFSMLQLEIAKSDEMLRTWMAAQNGAPLSDLDQQRMINMVSSYMIGFENMYSQSRTGMLNMEAYEARRGVIASFLGFTGIRDWWDNFGRYQFHEGFVADVEQAVKEFS